MKCSDCGAVITVPRASAPAPAPASAAAGRRPAEPWYYPFLSASAYLTLGTSALALALTLSLCAAGRAAATELIWPVLGVVSGSWLLAATRLGLEIARNLAKVVGRDE